jgi:hypothetical protein
LYRYTEVQPAFAVKAIEHVNSYYNAFVSELLTKIDAQQAQMDSLQGQVNAAASAAAASAPAAAAPGGALAKARAELRAHLEGVHPGGGLYKLNPPDPELEESARFRFQPLIEPAWNVMIS